jgi:hypothetical protein
MNTMPEGQQTPNPAGIEAASAVMRAMEEARGCVRAPSVGRIVHYTNLGDADGKFPPETQPALVVRVHPRGALGLWVFYPGGFFYMDSVEMADPTAPDPQRGRWSWPTII